MKLVKELILNSDSKFDSVNALFSPRRVVRNSIQKAEKENQYSFEEE